MGVSISAARRSVVGNPFWSGLVIGLGTAVLCVLASISFRTQAWSGPTRSERAAARALPASLPADPTGEALRGRNLTLPVDGYDRRQLRDSFRDGRLGHVHDAIDLMAPRGTPVRAVDDGVVRKLTRGLLGGITIYQVDPQGRYCYYYAHLDRYASLLHEGQAVSKGQVIAYVGSTGNASWASPHLHFAIFALKDVERFWDGTPVNPYPLWAGG